jgi:hypothetical protein
MHPDSLFIEAAKLTSQKEDLFTLAVAASLGEDPYLLRRFLRTIVGASVYKRVPKGGRLAVRTQVGHKTPRCEFDMVIDVDGRPFLVLEHKLWSPEGSLQIDKYLSCPRSVVPRVAYIAGYYAKSVSGSENGRYIRHPSKRLHFVWSEFYDLFAASVDEASGLRRATKALFDKYLFQPTHWAVAGLRDHDANIRAKADERVTLLIKPTRRALEAQPFGYETGSSWKTNSEFYATLGNSRRLAEVRLAPGVIPGALKLVLKCTSKAKALEVRDRVVKTLPPSTGRSSIIEYLHLGYSGRGNPHAIQVLTPWSALLGRYRSKREWPLMSKALKRHVVGIVSHAS